MKRQFTGLHQRAQNGSDIPEGIFLARVEGAKYRYHSQKPYYTVHLAVLEPEELAGKSFSGRLYCSEKALWKLSWFLRDFGYDAELLGQDEVDDKALVGLQGVVKVSHTTFNGRSYLNLEGFAPAAQWEELSLSAVAESTGDSHDL
jgi:hypothetical protein